MEKRKSKEWKQMGSELKGKGTDLGEGVVYCEEMSLLRSDYHVRQNSLKCFHQVMERLLLR